MQNDGQSLENLVALIERVLTPEEFQIETRKKIYNATGTQIAELDIVITGNLGSVPIKYLIECRDRPSEDSAPVSWIQQLVGRRAHFKFDKVMAVSTTGFSPGAKELAECANIELRNLQDLDYEAVASWLPYNAPLIIRYGELQSVGIFIKQSPDFESDVALPQRVDTKQKRFVCKETGEYVSLQEIWQDILNENHGLFEGLEPNGSSRELTVRANYTVSRKYQFLQKEAAIPIDYIDFQATLKIIRPNMPLSKVSEYLTQPADGKGEEKIVQFAQWKGKEQDMVKEIIFIGIPKKSTD